MSIAQSTTEINWTQLDESNRAHYVSKSRPDWVADAEIASVIADETHDAILEKYLDGSAEWDDVSEAESRAKAHYEYALDCRTSWHAGLLMPKYNLNYYLRQNGLQVEHSDSVPACYGLPD